VEADAERAVAQTGDQLAVRSAVASTVVLVTIAVTVRGEDALAHAAREAQSSALTMRRRLHARGPR